MIAGTMPKWQQNVQKSPVAVLFLLGVLFWWEFHSAREHQPPGHNVFAITWLLVLGLGLIAAGIWFQKSLIREFSYDGKTLTFYTLASSKPQVRDISLIEDVAEWMGRGGPMG